ncbi:27328_t:CDS:2, partial [Dentiscutata erythropus]
LRYWNRGVEVVSFLDRRWSLSESPLLEPLLLESECSYVTEVLLVEWNRVTGVLLVEWSHVTRVVVSKIKSRLLFLAILVIVYGTVGSGILLVDPCWSDSSICSVGIRSIFLSIIAEVSVFGLVSLR